MLLKYIFQSVLKPNSEGTNDTISVPDGCPSHLDSCHATRAWRRCLNAPSWGGHVENMQLNSWDETEAFGTKQLTAITLVEFACLQISKVSSVYIGNTKSEMQDRSDTEKLVYHAKF